MNIPLYIIDAFAKKNFTGNPAAVCPLLELSNWPDDKILQAIAQENNLSETAFFIMENNNFHIRWFTPNAEVDLCGHATIAAAHVLFKYLNYTENKINFYSKSGKLSVEKDNEKLFLNFPRYMPQSINRPDNLVNALNYEKQPVEILQYTDTYIAVYDNQDDILNINPNFTKLLDVESKFIIITAKGKNCDFVSRFFTPKLGINEDPVTGSAHSILIPYWSKKLNKETLFAMQLSKRKGELYCQDLKDRVSIGGYATTYLIGEIDVEI